MHIRRTGTAAEHLQTALHMLEQIKPEGALQSMLAVQMIGVHNSAIEFLMRAMDEKPDLRGDGCETAKGIVAEMNGPAKLVSFNHATNGERAPTKSRFIPHALDGQTTYSAQGRLRD